jgi:hypothetical protein
VVVPNPEQANFFVSDSAAMLMVSAESFELSIAQALAAGKCTGFISGTCTVTYAAVPADWHCDHGGEDIGKCAPSNTWTSITGTQPDPSTDNYPAPQRANIALTFTQPVFAVVVRMQGAFKCSGTLPTVTARNGVNDVLSSHTITISQPDCGADDVAGHGVDTVPPGQLVSDTLVFRGAVKKLDITGLSPWNWEIPVPGSDPQIGYAKAFWSVEFYQVAPGDTCLTGDDLLDTPLMREMLRKLRDDSNWDDSVKTNRKERGGYLFQLKSGDLQAIPFYSTSDDWCTTPIIPTAPDSARFLAIMHTHPFVGLDTMPPSGCLQSKPPRIYDPRPSNADFGRVRNDSSALGYPIRGYVVDKDSIYAIPPGTTIANRRTKVRGYALTDSVSGCKRL